MSPKVKTHLFNFSIFAGLLLATLLTQLKLSSICFSGFDCAKVFNSKFSALFGIPSSVYALILWSLFFIPNKTLNRLAAVFLSLGTVFYFIVLMDLKVFCPFCFAHGLAAFSATYLYFKGATTPTYAILGTPAGLALVLLFTGPTLPAANKSATPTPIVNQVAQTVTIPQSTTSQSALPKEVQWHDYLGSTADNANKAIISLTCNHCMDSVYSWLVQPKANPPKLGFLATGGNLEIHVHILAAVKSLGDTPAAFSMLFQHLKPIQTEFMEANIPVTAAYLKQVAPNYEPYMKEARDQLNKDYAYFKKQGVNGTPYVIRSNGQSGYSTDW
jgi:uncharacterized membrane protein